MDQDELLQRSIDADDAELARYGYVQQLRRSMGAFSSFALSFSLVSIVTGIFANFTFGYGQVGPAIVVSWCIVGAGQFVVALVLADLARRIPLSGYGYQWSSRLVNPHFGYCVGWLLLLQFLTGFPGVCHALATALCTWVGIDATAANWVAVLVITATALVHLFGIRLVSVVNDLGVVTEVVGVVAFTMALLGLAWWQGAPLSRLQATPPLMAGSASGISAFALSLLMGAWCLTGFEAAADLAEETRQPKRVVPRVILTAEITSAVAGVLLLVGLILNIKPGANFGQSDNAVIAILNQALGPKLMPVVMLVVVVSIFACAVASMAATTRLLFSLARDNMLPFSRELRQVHSRWQTPATAILLVWLLSMAVVLLLQRIEIITSVSATAGFLGYAGIIVASFRSRRPADSVVLGTLQTSIRIVALLWTLIVVAALTIPQADTTPGAIAWLPAKSTFAALLVGAVIYGGLVRGRILRHEAGPPDMLPKHAYSNEDDPA